MEIPRDGMEPNNNKDQATSLQPGNPVTATFYLYDDQDWYVFQLNESTTVALETYGNLDTYITLYNSDGYVMAENDDYSGYNARVAMQLSPGLYYVKLNQVGGGGSPGATYQLNLELNADIGSGGSGWDDGWGNGGW
jgi:hypothetical protein